MSIEFMTQARPPRFTRWHWLIVLAFLGFGPVLVIGAIEAKKTQGNNIEQWLPADNQASINHKHFLKHFGSDEFVMVSWQDCTLDDERLPRFAEAVRKHVEVEGEHAGGAATEEGAHSGEKPENEGLFASVSTGAEMLAKLMEAPTNLSRKKALERLYGVVVGRDKEITGTIIVFSEKGDEDRVATIQRIREIAQAEFGIAAVDLHMVGDAVTNAAVDVESKGAVDGLIGMCGLVALVMALISLRSVRLLVVVFVTAGYCYLMAQAAVYYIDFSSFSNFFGGKMNLVLFVMPVLIYVLAISGGVHLVNYYKDAALEKSLLEAPGEAISHGWVPCALAAFTTAVGVGSLGVSNIRPVKDFGTYSAFGVLASLIVLFYLLPSLLALLDKIWIKLRRGRIPDWPKRVEEGNDSRAMAFVDRISSVFIKHHGVTSTLCVIVLALFAWGALYINTDLKPRRFFPADHQLNTDYKWVAKTIGPQVPIEILVKIDTEASQMNMLEQLELAAGVESRIEATSEVVASLSAATFLPAFDETPRSQRYVVNKRLNEGRERLREALMLGRDGNENLWRISCRTRQLEDHEGYDQTLNVVESCIDEYLAGRLKRYNELLEKIPATMEKSRQKSREEFAAVAKTLADKPEELEKARKELEGDIAAADKRERILLEQLKDPAAGVNVVVTGMVPLFFDAQRELFDSLVESFVMAFALIAILMIILLQSWRAGLISMLPNVFPVVVIFGAMGWAGRFVDIGSMMTASVAMGIAVDDTVHFLTWFRRGMHEGMTRHQAVAHAYRRCAMAMTQTTAIAGLSLLVFGFSSFQPVSQFGTLMFVLLIAALVGDLIFLPALLAGRAGKLFEDKRDEAVAATPSEEPQPVEVS